jgi:hypothetical protein
VPRRITIDVRGNSNMDEDAFVSWLVLRLKRLRDSGKLTPLYVGRQDGNAVDIPAVTVAIQEAPS